MEDINLLLDSIDQRWTQSEAIKLCCDIYIENTAPSGGCLYKSEGTTRKDCDILFYRIRQVKKIDKQHLFKILSNIGISITHDYGWCVKEKYKGKNIDMFFPEDDGNYEQ